MNGNNVLEVLETALPAFLSGNGGREGLYINVATIPVRIWGNTAGALRLPFVAFGLLTDWGLFLLAAELDSVEPGLSAGCAKAAPTRDRHPGGVIPDWVFTPTSPTSPLHCS